MVYMVYLRAKDVGSPSQSICNLLRVYWVAVKELKLSYHNGYIEQIIGFLQYSNLN